MSLADLERPPPPPTTAPSTVEGGRRPAAAVAVRPASDRIWLAVLGVLCMAVGVGCFVWLGLPSASPAGSAPSIPPRFEASSADFEVVGILEGEQLVLYVTEYIGNAPLPGARLAVTLDDREPAVQDRGGGIYAAPFGDVSRARQVAVTVQIELDGKQDLLGSVLEVPGHPEGARAPSPWRSILHPGPWLLAIGAFLAGLGVVRPGRAHAAVAVLAALMIAPAFRADAHPGHGEGEAGVSRDEIESSVLPANSPRRLSDGSLFVPKQAQFILGIRTALTEVGKATRAIRLVGRVIGDPAASGTVQSTLIGRVELPAEGMPRVGQRVVRGQVLASVVPVINPLDRGNIQQQIALIDRDLGTLQQRAEGAANGNGNGNGADAAAAGRSANVLAVEIEGLARRRAAMNSVLLDREGLRVPLRAPTDGVIAVANATAGQIVDARDTLYEIVDPDRIWVEASAYDPTVLDSVVGASAVTSDGRSLALTLLGHGPKLTQQAIPLLFHVRQPTMLPIGTPVSVLVETRQTRSGIILPPAAVVRNPAGQTIVWQHAAAERFIPILVRTEPVDGRSVAVVAGLPDNRRVVVVGADLLNQIR